MIKFSASHQVSVDRAHMTMYGRIAALPHELLVHRPLKQRRLCVPEIVLRLPPPPASSPASAGDEAGARHKRTHQEMQSEEIVIMEHKVRAMHINKLLQP